MKATQAAIDCDQTYTAKVCVRSCVRLAKESEYNHSHSRLSYELIEAEQLTMIQVVIQKMCYGHGPHTQQ